MSQDLKRIYEHLCIVCEMSRMQYAMLKIAMTLEYIDKEKKNRAMRRIKKKYLKSINNMVVKYQMRYYYRDMWE